MPIATARKADIHLHEGMWTTMNRNHANIGTNYINDAPQHNHLLTHIAAETTQVGHTDPTKLVVLPAPNKSPDVLTPLLELNATAAMSLRPSSNFAQDTAVHAVYKD